MVSQNFLLDVEQHPDPEQDLVAVLVQMLAVLLVQVDPDVVLVLSHPGDSQGNASVSGQGRFSSLLLGLATARNGIGKAGVIFTDLGERKRFQLENFKLAQQLDKYAGSFFNLLIKK